MSQTAYLSHTLHLFAGRKICVAGSWNVKGSMSVLVTIQHNVNPFALRAGQHSRQLRQHLQRSLNGCGV